MNFFLVYLFKSKSFNGITTRRRNILGIMNVILVRGIFRSFMIMVIIYDDIFVTRLRKFMIFFLFFNVPSLYILITKLILLNEGSKSILMPNNCFS